MTVRHEIRTLALIAAAVVVMWALYLARDAVLLIYISGLLAAGFGPLVRAIEHQTLVPIGTSRMPRWVAILIIYLAIVGVIVTIGLLVVPPLVDQAQQLWNNLPSFIDRGETFLIEHGLLTQRITLMEAVKRAPGSGAGAVGTVATAVTVAVTAVLASITVLILTFYVLVETDTLFSAFIRLFPREQRRRVREASWKITEKVSAWLSGQLILSAAIGGSSAVALYLFGLPYFYVLALISAVGEMIPVLGPVLAAIPAVLVALTVSTKTAVFVAIFFVAQQQTENHLLVPKIMEKQVGVSAVTVIAALLIGASLHGIVGAILAVPTAAVLQVVAQELLEGAEDQA